MRGRAANPVWLAGMMRHGYAGGAEMARAVEALAAFAATLPDRFDRQFDLLHDATLGDRRWTRSCGARTRTPHAAIAARSPRRGPPGCGIPGATRSPHDPRLVPDRARADAVRRRPAGAGEAVRRPAARRALHALAEAVAAFGNGVVELTGRGNLQIRGVRDAPAFARAMVAAGLADPDPAREARRNVVAVPPCDDALVAEAEACWRHAPGCRPKFCVVV